MPRLTAGWTFSPFPAATCGFLPRPYTPEHQDPWDWKSLGQAAFLDTRPSWPGMWIPEIGSPACDWQRDPRCALEPLFWPLSSTCHGPGPSGCLPGFSAVDSRQGRGFTHRLSFFAACSSAHFHPRPGVEGSWRAGHTGRTAGWGDCSSSCCREGARW